MKQSNFLSLNLRDTLRSLAVALLTCFYYWIQDVLLPGIDLDPQIKALISAGLGYLTKNLFTPSDKLKSGIVGDRPPGDGGR